MTLLYCKILYTVAEQGSFLKAAEQLNLTPSAVSHSVSAMEAELNFQIFNRSKSGVTLTSYGEEIYPMVMKILNCEENLKQVVDRLNGLKRGTVKVGAFNSVCIQWLPKLLSMYREKFPDIDIEVYEGTYDDVLYWLNTGIIEIGFLSTSCSSEYRIVPLYEDPLVCIVPKGFKTKEPGKISVTEMQNHSFVIQRESCDADIKKYLMEMHINIHSSCHVTDDQSTVAMVEGGLGISIMPDLTSRKLCDNLAVLQIDPPAVRTIGVATPNKKGLTPAAQELMQLIMTEVANFK